MTPPDPMKRRAADALWVRVLREFGLPTLMLLWVFYTSDSAAREERRLAAAREERLTAVIGRLTTSIDASAEASRLATSELRQVGEKVGELAVRVDKVEEMGRRAMLARRTPAPRAE